MLHLDHHDLGAALTGATAGLYSAATASGLEDIAVRVLVGGLTGLVTGAGYKLAAWAWDRLRCPQDGPRKD